MSNRKRTKPTMTTGPEQRGPKPGSSSAGRGFVDRINAYRCDTCGAYTVTRDVDPGVTPMFLACRATPDCPGRGTSLGYPEGPVPDHIGPVAFEWYRPTTHEFNHLDPGMQQHIVRGGLMLRPVA